MSVDKAKRATQLNFQRPELVFLLQHSLAPLLLKLQAEKPTFPVALRVFRLIFLLIRFYAAQLEKEIEVFLLLLLRVGASDGEGEETVKKDATMAYQRVLALEALRGYVCLPLLSSLLTLQYLRRRIPPTVSFRTVRCPLLRQPQAVCASDLRPFSPSPRKARSHGRKRRNPRPGPSD